MSESITGILSKMKPFLLIILDFEAQFTGNCPLLTGCFRESPAPNDPSPNLRPHRVPSLWRHCHTGERTAGEQRKSRRAGERALRHLAALSKLRGELWARLDESLRLRENIAICENVYENTSAYRKFERFG